MTLCWLLGCFCNLSFYFFFFNDTATTEIYTLSLHDALPICILPVPKHAPRLRREIPGVEWRILPGCGDRKSTRLNSSHANISYDVFCLKKKRTLGLSLPHFPSRQAQHGMPACGGRAHPRSHGSSLARRGDHHAGRHGLFFSNDTATTEIYTLSLHDALPISEADEVVCHTVPDELLGVGRWYRDFSPVDRKSTRLNSSHANISYAVFCLK